MAPKNTLLFHYRVSTEEIRLSSFVFLFWNFLPGVLVSLGMIHLTK
jgi:hypothetical protein